MAFAAGCRTDGGVCEPRWTVALDSYFSIAYADEHAPLWSATSESGVHGVASDGTTVFAGLSGGEVVAYPVDCSDPCAPIWRASVPGEAWWFLLDNERLIVAARHGGAGAVGLTLQAFEARS